MPKHIHSEVYLQNPYQLFPTATIHPEIEHVPDSADTGHYLLPTVFTLKKGDLKLTAKYPGPGVFYIEEGEAEYENAASPHEHPVKLSAGSVVHVEKDSSLRWSSQSVAKGFAVFWVPVSVKGFDSFIVSDQ